MTRVAHLIDDTSPGGVSRFLEFVQADPGIAALSDHQMIQVPRRRPASVPIDADIIVSHLAISWRNLPGFMQLRAMYPDARMIHVEHSYCPGFIARKVPSLPRFHALLRCAYAMFDQIVAVSHDQRDWLLRQHLAATEAVSVISPCVDLSGFRKLKAACGTIRTIGAIGRFDEQKGFDILIQAFRTIDNPDLRLVLFGDGPAKETLVGLAGEDPRISFAGFAPAERAMGTCDAIAMPSRWEPYGLVALEARAAGRPVLVSDIDGLRDQAEEGAIKVRGHTVRDWSAAISRLVSHGAPAIPDRAVSATERTRAGWAKILTLPRTEGETVLAT